MQKKFIDTANYTRLFEGIGKLESLPVDAPRVGLAYGDYGLGKTLSLERIAALKDNIVLLRALQSWSRVAFLKRLCKELGLDDKGHKDTLYNRVVDELLSEDRILVVDELDTMLTGGEMKKVFEMIRDITDETGTIIVFIGMEQSDAKFKRERHYYSRVSVFVKFDPIGINDIEKFCALSDVTIQADLVHYFAKKWPNLRQVRVMLLALEHYCEMNEIKEVNLDIFKRSGVERGAKTKTQ